jgi:hypothetical protein
MNNAGNRKKNHPVAATIAFFSEAIRFIVIPLVILYILMDYLAQSHFAILLTGQETNRIATQVIVFGIVIAIFAAAEAFLPRGTKMRMVFGILAIGTLCLWFWFILSSQLIRFSIGQWNLSLNITGIAMLMVAVIALKVLIPIAQYMSAKSRGAPAGAGVPVTAVASGTAPAENITVDKEEPPPPEDFVMKCPKCGAEINASVDVCPKCGTWIRQKRTF